MGRIMGWTAALLVTLLVMVSWRGGAPGLVAAPEPSTEPSSTASIHDRRGVYLSCYAVSPLGYLDGVLEQSERWGLNAVVVDVKNDHGELSYASQVPLARTLGALSPRLDLADIVRQIQERGMYAIARQVVYRDPKLAQHLGAPGGLWVRPGDATAAAYNIAVAKEVAAAGFDELQLDYIRFPDEGRIGDDHTARCDAVEGFLAEITEAVSIPVSVDLYGRVMWPWNARKIDPIGQHLEGMAHYADVVSPMLYPSHYVEPEFMKDPYTTVHRALTEGAARTDIPMRPYLQAFDRAVPGGMTLPEYIVAQVRAAHDAGADGYLFWNPRSDYTALWEALRLLGES